MFGGLEICVLCRGFKILVLSVGNRKSVASKPKGKFLNKSDDVILFNRFIRHIPKATGIVDVGFVQIRSTFVTKIFINPLGSGCNRGYA